MRAPGSAGLAVTLALCFSLPMQAYGQEIGMRPMTIELPDGRSVQVDVPYDRRQQRQPIEHEVEVSKAIMKRTLYRTFREARCDSFQATLEATAMGLEPIEVPGLRQPAQISIRDIAAEAQVYIDQIQDPRLQSFMAQETNKLLRSPQTFKDKAETGAWSRECYTFMEANYFPEVVDKFQF